jgi:SAM-dependent methyltransferase
MPGASEPEGRATSFGGVAEAYNTFRPSPPPALGELLGPLDELAVVDLAAGTGLLTRFLVERGARVTAVEPDRRMAAVLASISEDVTVLQGSAEAIPLEDRSVDLVTVSSAWHWFDADAAAHEIGRILRPGGRLVVLWNGVNYVEPGWTEELARLRAEITPPSGTNQPRRQVSLPDDAPFGELRHELLSWTWPRTPAQVVGLLGTYSGALLRDHAAQLEFAERVRSVAERHAVDGIVELPMACLCVVALSTSSPSARRTS